MTSREGLNRPRLRPTAPIGSQVFTRLGRATPVNPPSAALLPTASTSVSTTVMQNSGNVRLGRNINNATSNLDVDANTIIDVAIIDTNSITSTITSFDAEQFRSEIKANGHDEKRLEQLILNAISYFLMTSKRPSQQIADYSVLTFLAWTVTIHSEIFRLSSVVKAMSILLKGSSLTKTMRTFPIVNNGNNTGLTTTPYILVCHILWLAFKVINVETYAITTNSLTIVQRDRRKNNRYPTNSLLSNIE
jgi:hypothetical protein